MRKKVAVLASGGGRLFRALVEHVDADFILISTSSSARVVAAAYEKSIPTRVLPFKDLSRELYDRSLTELLLDEAVDLICCVGYKRILSEIVTQTFPCQIMNLHPALLPAFKGFDPQKQTIDYGVRYSGATVHFVDAGVDTGPIITQGIVPVYDDDTEATLCQRLQPIEASIYIKAVNWFCQGALKVVGRKVLINKRRY